MVDENSTELLKELILEEFREIRDTSVQLKDLILHDQASRPLGMGSTKFDHLDFNLLVQMRQEHETEQAKKGVRTSNYRGQTGANKKEVSERQQLIRKFYEVLKEEQEDHAVGTGYGRKARWTVSAKGGQTGTEDRVSGNTANAIVVATNLAVKVFFILFSIVQLEVY